MSHGYESISCEPLSYRVENLCLFLQYFLLKFWNFGKRRGLKEPHLKLKVSQKYLYEVQKYLFTSLTLSMVVMMETELEMMMDTGTKKPRVKRKQL